MKASILVVDDEWLNRELLEGILKVQGYTVHLCHNADDALKTLHDQTVDLALIDVRMPGMDGYDLTRAIRLREHTRELPVILLTALEIDETEQTAVDHAGANAVLARSIRSDDLVAQIESLLLPDDS
jgi:two-component system, OmpR family, phosphate regulon response regulator OmpR